ncbi:MAG TPA: UMP kinase [Anaerohalosphaeraceae bacterium]|nr:UMP kinase [Phycisphaerae bacterium]HOK94702.1 UMP kinase [Anaerohalosphaeraceae bacterium]HOL30580.1 UMP kinase [Anaerohalosphaeraceae bacterium]HOM76432.1 UMP kinase [Anaerohalosphaeraceae bacterium]HPC63599.1 UMP kinase [Anaerohalosphaeraceae bacterium]
MTAVKYKRVLLKLSGESFCKPGGFGVEGEALESIAQRIARICRLGPQVAIVVGGGNFLRGAAFSEKSHIPRTTADYMGMLATVINACALQETLEKMGQPTRVCSAIEISAICEPFIRRQAIAHLENGRVVILAGGTGNPFFSTDTCAALRASELNADIMIKATKVDGVYTDDPMKNPKAHLVESLSYQQVLEQNLRIMDPAAVSLCRENHIPVVVLNIFKEGALTAALEGKKVGTLISDVA